ncbi:MAG TPA: CheR family methyltransferase [Marmoricola sp.]|nr:CheR family methyltransferase [Marmoricola sp.]
MTTNSDPHFEELLTYLKEQRGFDFTGYKRASLLRRVQRRMSTLHISSYEDYLDYLQLHPEEFTPLFNTILINVTDFFRDAEAWDYFRAQIVPDLLKTRADQSIRVWSAGCASGQEAYTLAMVFADALGIEDFRERVKIYATDVDEEALATARQAMFTEREIRGAPEEMREKYFERSGQRYTFRKELRRSVIFGRNDLVQDAPISHVDVLSCRNTLMYFNAETQAQVLQRLHFALRPEGILFLGKAEMLLSHSSLFRPVEIKRRFFSKVASDPRDRRGSTAPLIPPYPRTDESQQSRLRQEALLSSAQAQVVLDAESCLALANHRASQLFGLTAHDVGRPIQDLEVSYRPVELRTSIDEAARDRRPVWIRGVSWMRRRGESLTLDVQVVPLLDETGTQLGTTVLFNDVSHYRQLQGELEYANRQLETAYEELQSTNEELETTNEELQSTVEELETTNEELQSTNEELETMNEELQSMNDELHVSNEVLRERQDEVDHLNCFMSAVLGSMSAGVVVVDRDLIITAWNSKAEDMWGVRADEAVGEHLLNLDIGLPVQELRPMIKRQLSGQGTGDEVVTVDAVNRRGRTIEVQVTVSQLSQDGTQAAGAILVTDVLSQEQTGDPSPG